MSFLFILGPELPFIDDSNCTNTDGNFTCETELDNVVDVFYFDAADTFSCKDQVCFYYNEHYEQIDISRKNHIQLLFISNFQCGMLEDCNFWTFFDVFDIPQPHHKCFLFKTCDIHEPCSTCETGSKTRTRPWWTIEMNYLTQFWHLKQAAAIYYIIIYSWIHLYSMSFCVLFCSCINIVQ